MKSLKTILKLTKLGKVLSVIMFVMCIVAFCVSAAATICLAVVGDKVVEFGNVTFKSMRSDNAEVNIQTLYLTLAVVMLFCIVGAIISRLYMKVFNQVLEDKTPFTFKTADAFKRLGLIAIFLPIGASIAAGIGIGITKALVSGIDNIDINSSISVSQGLATLVLAVFCRYGAEVAENPALSDKK